MTTGFDAELTLWIWIVIGASVAVLLFARRARKMNEPRVEEGVAEKVGDGVAEQVGGMQSARVTLWRILETLAVLSGALGFLSQLYNYVKPLLF